MKNFFANHETIDLNNYIIETYWFETKADPEKSAASLCSEQSTAQWTRPGVKEDLREKFGAKILDLKILERSRIPCFDSPFNKGESFTRCSVKIAHPIINFGAKIPNLLTAICGEGAFHSPNITSIKLLDLGFPKSYLDQFEGPRFGIKGIRDLLQNFDRPVFIGVVKPNIGLDVKDFAEISYQSFLGGLDIAKDDEMLADVSYSSLKERVKRVNEKRLMAQDKTGEKKIFLANITDEVDRIIELHDIAVENGAGAVMVNSMTIGLSAIRMLRKKASVPIVGHFDFIAPFTRIPFFGVSSNVITKLQRLSGCDAIIMPGFGKRMLCEEQEILSNVHNSVCDFGNIKSALPVPGGSDWAGTLSTVYDKMRTIDFGFVMGRGVFDHPMGARFGAVSVRQAWDAILQKIPIDEYAKDNVELKKAIETFGKKEKLKETKQSKKIDQSKENKLESVL